MPKKVAGKKIKISQKKENQISSQLQKKEILDEKPSKKNEKAIATFLIILGAIIVLLIVAYLIFFSLKYAKYDYKGIKFNTVQTGKLLFYKFSIPVYYQGKEIPYNFYIRTNPRILKKVVFNNLENYQLMTKIVIVAKSNFTDCEGDEIIALANLAKLYTFIGAKVDFKYANQTLCDLFGKTLYLNIDQGNETKIFQTGPSCYQINVKDCEILKATEKIMVETVVKYNQL